MKKLTNFSVASLWNESMQDNYGTPSLALARGKGSHLYDVEGNKYLDMLSGIATTTIGHSHPSVTRAISKQSKKLGHTSNLYAHQPGLELAAQLIEMTGEKNSRVFFCNSGAEANEAALKLSRLTGRTKILSTVGSFHGRTMGSLSMTGQPSKRDPFKPVISGVEFIEYNDIESAKKAISEQVAMVIVEPIQGENGVITPSPEYLRELRRLTNKYGVLLAIDAVQTGMGRTGEWFGYEHTGITPDLITLAKGLGGGLPLGAMIRLGSKAPYFTPGSHGSTFGGNPIACAASLATISVIRKEKLLARANSIFEFFQSNLNQHPSIELIRGQGALIGILLKKPQAKLIAQDLKLNGVLVGTTSEYLIRIAPPLNISQRELNFFLKIFTKRLNSHAL